MQRRIGAPTLYVTHDQTEAMTMGDRVAILRDGVLEQLGTPLELYDAPVNTFVAGFIGSPAMNLVDATVEDDGDARFASFAGARLPIGREHRVGAGPVRLGLRPEDLGRDGDGVIELPVAAHGVARLGDDRLPRVRRRAAADRALRPPRRPARRASRRGSPSTSTGCTSSIARPAPRYSCW